MRSKPFFLLMIGQGNNSAVMVLYIVALMHVIYQQSGSAFMMSMVPVVITFTRFFSGLLAPLLFTYFSLPRILLYAQGIKVILFICLFVMIFFMPGATVFFVVSMIALLDGIADPASQSLLPRIVAKTELMKANSTASVIFETVGVGCWAIGGVLLVFVGAEGLLLFVISFSTIAAVAFWLMRHEVPSLFETNDSHWKKSMLIGWNVALQTKWLKQVMLTTSLDAVAGVVWMAAAVYLFVEEVLQVSEAWWGWINASFFIGLIVTGFFLYKQAHMLEKQTSQLLKIGFAGGAVITAFFALNTIPVVALVLSIGIGMFEQVRGVGLNTILQQHIEAKKLPYVYAVQASLSTLSFGMGALLVGVVAEAFDIRIVYALSALLLLLCFFSWMKIKVK